MPIFSSRSKGNLVSTHRDLQIIMNVAILLYDFAVIEGHRNKERQNQLLREGKTQLRWPNSKHNKSPSNAVDVVPYPIDWNDLKRFHYLAGIIMTVGWVLLKIGVVSHSLRWGGDWNGNGDFTDQSFNDLGHFELIE